MSDDDKVGYCKPPKKNQFKKGVSPNPKGRPKGAKNVHTIVDRVMNAPIKITKDGKSKSVTMFEAALMQQSAKAAKGELKSFVAVTPLFRDVQEKKDLQGGSSQLLEIDRLMIASMLRQYSDLYALAQSDSVLSVAELTVEAEAVEEEGIGNGQKEGES